MILRPRQIEMKDKCVAALREHGNTLAVAPTGAGKTVIISSVTGSFPGTSVILQHREELLVQNRRTFLKVNPGAVADIFSADRKRFINGGATFAMVQTLCRNIERMPFVDFLGIDEAHHTAAESYEKIITAARERNPALFLFGVTATPERADKKGLKKHYSNVADIITITELIQSGHLVRPRTFVVECGLRDELEAAKEDMRRRRLADYDMSQIEKIMDNSPVNTRVFEEWQKHAGARRTVIFCSTVDHAQHVCSTFVERGIKAEVVHGAMSATERRAVLRRLDTGETQVVVNVAVLTEGFDCQPLSCVVLLRPCSHKSTMMQMIGRGLRRLDPERYPGIQKDDCIILDFGYSLLKHGNFNIDVELDPEKRTLPSIYCPKCETLIPANVMECPVCGEIINVRMAPTGGGEVEKGVLEDFVLTEIDILDSSPFRWEDLFDGIGAMANGIDAWAFIMLYRGRWHALGGGVALAKESLNSPNLKSLGDFPDRLTALGVADDFMRAYGNRDAAKKSKAWLALPPTDTQIKMLKLGQFSNMTRYRACCLYTFKMFESRIQSIITSKY